MIQRQQRKSGSRRSQPRVSTRWVEKQIVIGRSRARVAYPWEWSWIEDQLNELLRRDDLRPSPAEVWDAHVEANGEDIRTAELLDLDRDGYQEAWLRTFGQFPVQRVPERYGGGFLIGAPRPEPESLGASPPSELFEELARVATTRLRFLRLNPEFVNEDRKYRGGEAEQAAFLERWEVPPGLFDERIDENFFLYGPPSLREVFPFRPMAVWMQPVVVMGQEESNLRFCLRPANPVGVLEAWVAYFHREARRQRRPLRGTRARGSGGGAVRVELDRSTGRTLCLLVDVSAGQKNVRNALRKLLRLYNRPGRGAFWCLHGSRYRSALTLDYEVTCLHVDTAYYLLRFRSVCGDTRADREAAKLQSTTTPVSRIHRLLAEDPSWRSRARRDETVRSSLERGLALAKMSAPKQSVGGRELLMGRMDELAAPEPMRDE